MWIAYAEEYGPWWGERSDLNAARICQTVAASVGSERELSEFRLNWSTKAEPIEILPWAQARAVLRSMCS